LRIISVRYQADARTSSIGCASLAAASAAARIVS